MNITYLFGNGFDVNLGLPTRYTDYYPEYIALIRSVLNTKDFDELSAPSKSIRQFWQHMKNEDTNWADFEKAIALFAKGDETDIKAILSDFTTKFSDYLQKVAQSKECNEQCAEEFIDFILNGQDNLQRHDKALMAPFKIKYGSENHIINIITFNYTDSVEKILESNSEKYVDNVIIRRARHNTSDYTARIITPVLHIHGTLNDEDSVIIGIDSIDQFSDENLKHNEAVKEYCVKTQINEDIGYGSRESQFKTIISNSNVIYTYGVSFGETDKTRWKIVKEWLTRNADHKLVVYCYDTKLSEIKSTYAPDLLDRIKELKKGVMQKIGIDIGAFEKFKNQIFIIDSSTVMKSEFTVKSPVATVVAE